MYKNCLVQVLDCADSLEPGEDESRKIVQGIVGVCMTGRAKSEGFTMRMDCIV